MGKSREKRKIIVEKGFQLRYAAAFAVTSFFMGVIVTVALVSFSLSYFRQLQSAGVFLTPTLAAIYRDGWIKLCFLLGGITLIYSMIAFYVGLLATRNIVGPVFAFKYSIEKLLDKGNKEEFELRKSDELHVLKEIYSKISQKM